MYAMVWGMADSSAAPYSPTLNVPLYHYTVQISMINE